MNARKNPFSHIRLIYRRSSTLVKCVVLAAIVLSTVALITLRISIRAEQKKQEQLHLQQAQLEQENYELTRSIAELGTVESVKRIATLQLGLVDPDSQFFTPSN
jgi:cell division protein FtsL